jgi:periplasmic divalent cation tolerance protein
MDYSEKVEILIATTTCSSPEVARKISVALIDSDLVACCQVDGPLHSYYKWKGDVADETEWRITMKYNSRNSELVMKKVLEIHPYELPQWIEFRGEAEKNFENWVNNTQET